jgi:myo-inositol-1(or 4)-monophosphatase
VYSFLCVALAKSRTLLGLVHRSRIRRLSASTLSVSFPPCTPALHLTHHHLPPGTGTDWPLPCTNKDGTTNFVHGFPYACISLGLIDQRVPVLGVIYNPFLEHLYTGVRGAGSFLHTHTPAALGSAIGTPQRLPLAPASARPLPALAGALIAVEWGSDRTQEAIRRKAGSFSSLAGAPPHGVMAHSLRSVGSAALNFALVAQGALDMYWCVSYFLPHFTD